MSRDMSGEGVELGWLEQGLLSSPSQMSGCSRTSMTYIPIIPSWRIFGRGQVGGQTRMFIL